MVKEKHVLKTTMERMEVILTELMLLDEVDGEIFEKCLFPLVEEVGKLRTLVEKRGDER
jgi:hypothetical protein